MTEAGVGSRLKAQWGGRPARAPGPCTPILVVKVEGEHTLWLGSPSDPGRVPAALQPFSRVLGLVSLYSSCSSKCRFFFYVPGYLGLMWQARYACPCQLLCLSWPLQLRRPLFSSMLSRWKRNIKCGTWQPLWPRLLAALFPFGWVLRLDLLYSSCFFKSQLFASTPGDPGLVCG